MGRRIGALAAVLAVALVLPACAAGPATRTASADGMIAQLNYGGFGGGSNPQRNFNPYSPNKLDVGYVFEPLMITNQYSCEPTPWLATDYRFDDPTTLTFDIRPGVTWNDGRPFGPDDVVYTFELLKANPGLDQMGIARYYSAVAATDTTVTFTLTEPYSALLEKIAATVIVPQHVWEAVPDPLTFTNDEPVGTGPFTVASMDRQQMTLQRNPTYWQAENIKVERIGFTNNDGGGPIDQLKLARGEYDSNSMFVPDIENTYVARDREHNKYWFPPGSPISLYLNLTKAPFDDLEFRRAVSMAINREEIRDKAQFGYVEVASQTGLRFPGDEDWLAPGLPDQGRIAFDPVQADRILTAAGYVRGPNGARLGRDGTPMTFTFQVPGGYTDWVQAVGVIQTNLATLGITVDVQSPATANVESARATGDYDMVFGVAGGQCSMYENFAGPLASANTAPVGEKAVSNYVRWSDPTTDALLAQLRATQDADAQRPIVAQLQQIMVDRLPLIPLWLGGKWYEYRTENAVGWPSAQDPYAAPGDHLLIINRLRPAAG